MLKLFQRRHAAHFPVWELVWKIPATQGPQGVPMTNIQLGIDSTHLFNGNRDQASASTTPAHHDFIQLLKTKLMSPRRGAPASPVLASTSVMNLRGRGPQHSEKHTPAPDSISPFYCNSYSHMDHFLTSPLFIFQNQTFSLWQLAWLSNILHHHPHAKSYLTRKARKEQCAAKQVSHRNLSRLIFHVRNY